MDSKGDDKKMLVQNQKEPEIDFMKKTKPLTRKKNFMVLWLMVWLVSVFCLMSLGRWYIKSLNSFRQPFNIFIVSSEHDNSNSFVLIKILPQTVTDYFGLIDKKSKDALVEKDSHTTKTNYDTSVESISATMGPLCSGVPDLQKFDCYPDAPVTEEQCTSRGCCWHPLNNKREENYSVANFPPLGIPYCFYPANYVGYKVTSIKTFRGGVQAVLQRVVPSGFPKDINKLNVTVTYYNEGTVRIKITDYNSERYEVPFPNWSAANHKENINELYKVSLSEDGTLKVTRKSSGIVVFNSSLSRLVFADQFMQLTTNLPSTVIYGIGEHKDRLLKNVNWTRYTLFNRDMHPVQNRNLYGSHPFYLVIEDDGSSHGVFLHNSNAMDIILQPTPALTFRPIGGVLDLFVFLGPSPDTVVQQYTNILGRPFMPPYWSLGFHLCRFGYGSLNKTRLVWQRTRDAQIPFDVQWNDIDYMNKSNDFTYDKVNYNGLPEFVNELHDKGMHYVIMVDPGISNAETPGTYPPYDDGIKADIFVKNSTGQLFIGKVWNRANTVFPDFSHPAVWSYWTKQFQSFHSEVSFDGAWIDMNEPSNFYNGQINGCPKNSSLENPPYVPGGVEQLCTKTLCMTAKHYSTVHYNEHNLYSKREAAVTNFNATIFNRMHCLVENRGCSLIAAAYGGKLQTVSGVCGVLDIAHALRNTTGKRPFIISRASSPGQGLYSGHWNGDISSSWEDMMYSIPSLLNFNMFGMPMMGSDICGFSGNTTVELCARWTALGAFYTFSRNHNDLNNIDQDPVALGPDVVNAARISLRMRYFLLPYLYTLFYRSHVFGETVARPLSFEYPKDKKTLAIDEQFMWGSSLMIIPVLNQGATSVTAYLPAGLWFPNSRKMIKSVGESYTFSASLSEIILAARGGSILPTQAENITTTLSRQNPFSLSAYMDVNQEASGELYWDDGESIDSYEKKQYNLINFSIKSKTMTSEVVWQGFSTTMTLSYFVVSALDVQPTTVTVNGKEALFLYDNGTHTLGVEVISSLLQPITITWK